MSTANTKETPTIGIEELIAEVKKRPLLYDPRIGGNSWRDVKPKLWREVCRAATPEWSELSMFEQQKRVIEAQKRWRTLRDNFKRELRHQKAIESGKLQPPRRKKYKHYDLLQFLEPVMNKSLCEYELLQQKMEEDSESTGEYGALQIVEEDTMGCEETRGSFEGMSGHPAEDRDDLEIKLGHYALPSTAHFDPDEMFFYSMLPAFKRLSERQKSLVKVKITQLMHDTIYTADSGGQSTSVESTIGPKRNSDSTTS